MGCLRSRNSVATCLIVLFLYQVYAAPLDFDKSGEDQVKEAVQKAEEAAKHAAEESVSHGHKAETRVPADKLRSLASDLEESLREDKAEKKVTMHNRKHARPEESDDDVFQEKRVKEHRVHRKPSLSRLMGIGDMGDSGNSNSYKEDTKLEDRLAMEAEEEKKYEDGYGGSQWDSGAEKGASWASNIQRQDAAEKQSIQAQVASESAHELDEIQNAITSESQSSRGSASMGEQGASVIQVGSNGATKGFSSMEMGHNNEAGATSEAPSMKSFGSSSHDLSRLMAQSSKLSSSELEGPSQQQYTSDGGMGFGGQGGQEQAGMGQESMGTSQMGQEGAASIDSLEGGRSPLGPNSFTGGLGGRMEESSYGGRGEMAGILGRGESESSLQGMGAASYASNQQQSVMGGAATDNYQSMMGGGSMQSLGGDAGGSMQGLAGGGGIQSFGGGGGAGLQTLGGGGDVQTLGGQTMQGVQSYGGGAGMQSFGGGGMAGMQFGGMQGFPSLGGGGGGAGMMAGQMGYKKRSHTAKLEKTQKASTQGSPAANTSKVSHHHHRHRHHHKRSN
ncbi:spidroin-1 isoform X1 [Nematostella vectensis]|uniref:spidroin-1 isoform X1 n=1 Tax=Nematostella vectensis TaxID=45351 RepID=UPI0020775B49|nr:spidroin-1 isoform X1 [Nematostella vectensis]XP_032241338.2 spidroin-1 isoform X1 [Nematostella vectensis]